MDWICREKVIPLEGYTLMVSPIGRTVGITETDTGLDVELEFTDREMYEVAKMLGMG